LFCVHCIDVSFVLVCDWLHSGWQNHFYLMLSFDQGYRLFQNLYFRNVLLKVQRRFFVVSKSEELGSQASVRTAQSCVRMPINVYCSSLHPSEHFNNTSGRSSEFQKNLAFKCIRLDNMAIPSGLQSMFDK